MSSSSQVLLSFNNKNSKNSYKKLDEYKDDMDFKFDKKFIEYLIHKKFITKYISMPLSYNINIIDNIIYNDKTHIVSLFKDHLIMDDRGDFLKRYYTKEESDIRLPKFFEFYDLYSKIFPNYTSLEEGKYFYSNIQQKQKIINIIEQKEFEKKMKNNYLVDNNSFEDTTDQRIFSTNIIDSLLNITNEEGMEQLFNVNKNNIKKEDNEFFNELNHLIERINNNNKSKKINSNNYSLNKNGSNNKCNSKNINFSNNKSNNNENNNKKNDLKLNSIAKFFNNINKAKNKNRGASNKISNLYNNCNYTKINLHHKKKNANLFKLNAMTDRALLDKLENNYNKVRQKNSKNISQNMSTSTKTKKDISSSKKNISTYNKKLNSISTSYQNLLNNFNDKLVYLITTKGSTNEIKNMKREILNNSKKTCFSSRNNALNYSSYIIKNKNKLNSCNNNNNKIISNSNKNNNNKSVGNTFNINNSMKNINLNVKKINTIKGNYKDSRNRQFSKNNYIKHSSSKVGSLLSYTNSILSNNDSRNNSKSKNNSKNNINNYTNTFFDLSKFAKMKVIHSKKNNSKKKLIKENILYNGFKICNSSRNQKDIMSKKCSTKHLTNSKIKNSMNKNNSLQKIGIIEVLKDNKKNKIKGIKINNFSKIYNAFINHCNKKKENIKRKSN